MKKPCRIKLLSTFPRTLFVLGLALIASASTANPTGSQPNQAKPEQRQMSSSDEFLYDARMSFLKAGELFLQLNRAGQNYEVAGQFQTSRSMSSYYSWNGIFAAVGTWQGQGPVTQAYMSRTVSKDEELKIVLTYQDEARVLEGPEEDFEDVEKPHGIDLISALFFSQGCYEGGQVHDGEDTYQLTLRKQREHELKAGAAYYRGDVVSCDYGVIDHKGRKRRVIVSLAEIEGTIVAVQLRAKIPIFPDAVFRLRMPKAIEPDQLAMATK